jgi:hypothetical protein
MRRAGGSGHRRSRVAGAEGVRPAAAKVVFSPGNRKILFVLAGMLALVFVFVGSNVAANHEPRPHGLPLGIAGPPPAVAAVTGQLDRRAPGAFAVQGYGSPAAARTAILHRSIYGALEPGPRPVLLIADAASSFVAALLQQTFQAAAHAQGQRLTVHDLAPLPPSDPTGATSYMPSTQRGPSARDFRPAPRPPPCATSSTSRATAPPAPCSRSAPTPSSVPSQRSP